MFKSCKYWTHSLVLVLQSALNSFIVWRWCYRHRMTNIFLNALEMQYVYMNGNNKIILISYRSAAPIFERMTSGLGWY